MSWLTSLPHQIPFRAASTGRLIDEQTIEGDFLSSANDPQQTRLMAAEAMAQLAGALVFDPSTHGFLSGIDDLAMEREIGIGEILHIRVHRDAALGGVFRFTASGSIDGVEVARGRFYLSHASA